MSIIKDMEKFFEFLRQEKGISEKSLRDYRLALSTYSKYADPLASTRYRDVAEVIVKIKQARTWSERTTYKLVAIMSVFTSWAAREGLLAEDPFRNGHSFKKCERHNIEYFDWDDPGFKKLFNHPNLTIRMKCILHVLKSSGVRASELCNLRVADVQGRWLEIKNGKGGRDRSAPIDEETRFWLAVYIKGLRDHYQGEWLFPREDFKGPIKPGSLQKMFARLSHKLGFRIFAHKFRHSLAGHLIKRGADLAVAAQVLGHKSVSTTMIYTHLKRDDVLLKYDEALKVL